MGSEQRHRAGGSLAFECQLITVLTFIVGIIMIIIITTTAITLITVVANVFAMRLLSTRE